MNTIIEKDCKGSLEMYVDPHAIESLKIQKGRGMLILFFFHLESEELQPNSFEYYEDEFNRK